MFSKPRLSINVEPAPGRPFFTTNDVIKGSITIDTTDQILFEDIQLKLKCDEWFPNGNNKNKSQRRMRNWKGRFDAVHNALGIDFDSTNFTSKMYMDHEKHFSLSANILTAPGKGKIDSEAELESGRHSLPFEIVVPERANFCPPSAYIGSVKTNAIGVIWSLKVVIHRKGGFKRAIRQEIEIPMFPKSDAMLVTPNFSRRERYFNTMCITSKRKLFGLFGGSTKLYVSGDLSMPKDGLSQGPFPSNFSLHMISPQRPVTVSHVQVILTRCFRSTDPAFAMDLDENIEEETILSATSVNKTIDSTTDLTEALNHLSIRGIFAPTFTAKYFQLSYDIQVHITCQSPFVLKSDAKKFSTKDKLLFLGGPCDFLSPLYCYTAPLPNLPPPEADNKKLQMVHEENMQRDAVGSKMKEAEEEQLPGYSV